MPIKRLRLSDLHPSARAQVQEQLALATLHPESEAVKAIKREKVNRLANQFEALLWRSGIAVPVKEHRFDTVRKFRFDYAWPSIKLAVELEGGTWVSGRHNRAASYSGDCRKYNLAISQGWRVLRFTTDMVREWPECESIIVACLGDAPVEAPPVTIPQSQTRLGWE